MDLQDILNLRDAGLPQRAREAYQAAISRVATATAAISDAEAAVAAARATRANLVQRAAEGEAIDTGELVKAEAAIRAAEDSVLFRRESLAAAEAAVTKAGEDLRTAEQRAWEPVLAAGIKLRIEGAAMIVEAKRLLANGEAAFGAGVEAVGRAMAGGVNLRLGFMPGANPEMFNGVLSPEHPNPDAERRTWAAHLDGSGDVILPDTARKLLEAAE
ncbi:hypothetical protein [Acidiphilium cryptum]|uniref:Uncharacterized protein n=1 Tax=Acidiphilium cryptum (strain JF-5) TaxID=349163 RepID=A5G0W1_ACICJ|nr:hypothetical protein [Acidiphilium cryptum]ABQ31493.1 hypothetical protein Acry_2298 [Acidiphilium cryptum JF-5]